MLSPVLTIASIPPADDAIDLMDIDSIKSTFDELIARKLPDDSAIEEWLADWSLLAKRISEAGTLADISFSKQTDDTDRLAAVEHYEEVVMPIVRQAEDALNRRLIETGWSRPDMERPIARIKTDMGIFRLDNVPLLGEDTLAGNRYAQMSGGLVADFDGEQRTAKKISGYLLKPDRTVRESAWRTATGLYSGIREPLDALYGEMVARRTLIATNADLENYTSFRWLEMGRFDYSPNDVQRFHQAVLATAVPAVQRRMEARRQILGLDVLRPWDLDVDLYGDPIHPFNTADELVAGAIRAFNMVRPSLATHLEFMRDHELFDLDNRPNKQPGGFMASLERRGWPFIFMNSVQSPNDIFTMLHESGHAVHTILSCLWPLIWQANYSIEAAELASHTMELIAGEMTEAVNGGFYSRRDWLRTRIAKLDEMLQLIPWIAIVDAQQQWAYANPTHTNEERAAHWLQLHQQYMVGPDWTGIEEERSYWWQQKLHFFQVPLYYIEYGIAWFGALQVWRNWREDPETALNQWMGALRLGGTANLPTVYGTAGAKLVFDTAEMAPLVKLMVDEIETLEHELLSMPTY